MRILFIFTLMFSFNVTAEATFESRLGMTALHNEGRPIARYLSENKVTIDIGKLDLILQGDIYGTQRWATRVKLEEDWLGVDAVRFQYGAEVRYNFNKYLSVYTRKFMPIDRNDSSEGDGWNDTSYRWDYGVVFKHKF